MKKRTVWVAALMSLSVSGMAQQVLPKDVAGDKEYARVCKEYELRSENSLELLEAYLKQYPDSRHANRIEAMMASVYFEEGKYAEAIALYRSCNLDALPDKERDEAALKLATSYLKLGNLEEAKVWFTLLKEVSKTHQADAVYNLGYIDYVEGRYDAALKTFTSLKNDDVYDALVPYYIGEIHLTRGEYKQADEVASDYLRHFAGHKDEAEMNRIQGEARSAMKDYLNAIASLEAYVNVVPQPQRKAMYELGMSYYHTGAYSKATEMLGRTTMEQDALAQNANLHMGLAYLQLKERNQARMAFEQASVADHDLAVKEQALYNYALCIHETSYSPFAESVTVFERFLNEFPASRYRERVNDYLVETYMNTRSYDAALKSIAKISKPGPRIMEAKQKILFRLGTQAFANARFEEALQYFNRSLEVGQYNFATQADASYWRGEAYYRLKNYKAAGQDFRKYLELTKNKRSPEYGLALYNLGYTDFNQKNYHGALNWFGRFVNESVHDNKQVLADAYNRMGDCNFYARKFDDARRSYDKAEQVDPSLGDYSLYQEGFVKGLQRDYTGKIQSLNQLITNYPQSQYIDDALYEQGRAFVQL
jgi:tetratricopeptide (TPR) repeat protein